VFLLPPPIDLGDRGKGKRGDKGAGRGKDGVAKATAGNGGNGSSGGSIKGQTRQSSWWVLRFAAPPNTSTSLEVLLTRVPEIPSHSPTRFSPSALCHANGA
jgi:hypothetical protein